MPEPTYRNIDPLRSEPCRLCGWTGCGETCEAPPAAEYTDAGSGCSGSEAVAPTHPGLG